MANSGAIPLPPAAADRLLLLTRVGRIIASDLNLFEMLQKTADAIHELLGYANVDLPLVDVADPEVLVVRVRGGAYKARIQRREDRIPTSSGVMGAAVRERRTQVVNDVAGDARYVQPPSGLSIRAELAVPILHSGRPLGVVNVEGDEPFSDLDVKILEMVADQLAVAIENARLFEQERRLAALEERQRLARELHDSVSQLLFSVTLLAESIAEAYRRDAAEGERRTERLLATSRQALAEMRALLKELAPAKSRDDFSSRELPLPSIVYLHREGLVAALRSELEALAAAGLATHLDCASYERQSREREEVLLRVAQEALANVSKHSLAKRVRLAVECDAGAVVLRVVDDGRGFDARSVRGESSDPARGGGLGLAGMRDRLRALGGALRVESGPGMGTEVEARFPR